MNLKRNLLIALAILLFAGGNILNLFVSSNLLWGEMEAHLTSQNPNAKNLDIECPLMIAPWETGTVRTVVTNNVPGQSAKPQVNAFIGRESGDGRMVSQTLELDSFESRSLQWEVDSSDAVFERLILVNILQRPYRDLDSHQGACSIYVFSLIGLNGRNSLMLLMAVGILFSVTGFGLLYRLSRPLSDFMIKVLQVFGFFLLLVLAGLFSSLPRLWGLTLVLNAAALLVITVASVEIFFAPKK